MLITRDQLSDLRNALTQVLELAEEGVLSPRNFVAELKAMAARLSRNQEAPAGAPGGSTLAELGLIGEYVEDLPYRSEVLGLSLDDWEAWPAERQLDFVHRARSSTTRPCTTTPATWKAGGQDTLSDLRKRHIGYVLQTGGLLP